MKSRWTILTLLIISMGALASLQAKITLLSPNGGGTLVSGAPKDITWTTEGVIISLKIELTIDNGNSWSTIASEVPNNGSYTWTVPELDSKLCKIRIRDDRPMGSSDTSDSTFTILSYKKLTLTAPNGGEIFYTGTNRTITWSTLGIVDSVDLSWSPNGGTSWIAIAQRIANSGSFIWAIPDTTSDSCLVVVRDIKSNGIADTCNSYFRIRKASSLTLTAPNGGDSLSAQSNYDILWSSTGSIDSVRIDITLNNGTLWQSIVQSTPNTGSFAWLVPDTLSDSCKVRVVDLLDTNIVDLSDSLFTIAELIKLKITHPNGGETLKIGTKDTITWNTFGTIDSVKIQFSKDNGATWITFTSKTVNTGLFEFYVPAEDTTTCRIKVQSATDTSLYDISDSVFSIVKPNISIQTKPGYKANSFLAIGPNPVGSQVQASFRMEKPGPVDIALYSLRGQRITTLLQGSKAKGVYRLSWNLDKLIHTISPGTYVVVAKLDTFTFRKSITRID